MATVAIDGVWWRQVPHATDPLFRPDPTSDGRWQRGEVAGALYFADSEETAWAEWYRALAELAISPDRQMPRDLWRWEVEVNEVADLSNEEKLAAADLPPPQPTRREWPAFQAVGERLWAGWPPRRACTERSQTNGPDPLLFRENDVIGGARALRPPTTFRQTPAPPTRNDHLTAGPTFGRTQA